jgi:hypothetical protein
LLLARHRRAVLARIRPAGAGRATGVSLVLVNGVITWRDGQPVTTSHPGQLIS